jgi:hypothetical protein
MKRTVSGASIESRATENEAKDRDGLGNGNVPKNVSQTCTDYSPKLRRLTMFSH